jgi:hypothetical protein
MAEECPLCLEPLSTGPDTKLLHPMNGVCDGFNSHVTCQVAYVHSHITQGTRLVCTRCNLNMAPQGEQHAARLGIDVGAARREAEEDAEVEGARRVLEIWERRARQRVVNDAIFLGDLFFAFTGGVSTLVIVTTGGGPIDYAYLGATVVYTYMRHTPYLVPRPVRGGKSRKRGKRGGTKNIRNYVLKLNEVAVTTIRNPTEELIHKVERMTGKRCKTLILPK